jgi:hypothetical protein
VYSIGNYLFITLSQAHKAMIEARKLLVQGKDPSQAKQEAKAQAKAMERNTFKEVAREFHKTKAEGWSEGHAESYVQAAHAITQCIGQVFRHGIQTGKCTHKPVPDLQGALKPVIKKHVAAILEPRKVGEFLRACEGYEGQCSGDKRGSQETCGKDPVEGSNRATCCNQSWRGAYVQNDRPQLIHRESHFTVKA